MMTRTRLVPDYDTEKAPVATPTGVLIHQAITAFAQAHQAMPGIVQLSPLRLLTIPGTRWRRYPVAGVFVELRPLVSLALDEVSCVLNRVSITDTIGRKVPQCEDESWLL